MGRTKQAQTCCKMLDGVLKEHTGRPSAKDMRTNILIWAKSTLMSILTWGSNMRMSTLVLVRLMRMSTLVLVKLTQTSMDANHRELNRSFSVYMPPTASLLAVRLEAHSERRLCVPVASYLS